MKKDKTYKILVIINASVWIINGLLCKVFILVPRHQEIVATILGNDYSGIMTKVIGMMELLLAIWIISDYKTKLHATLQIFTVMTMNVIEFFLVPDLLLWGKFNIIFALAFISLIHYTYFIHNNNYVRTS
ncbi:DoxX-like family protein [Winogradskyella sp.]|uniref:DoxX-like family protein n=2 Tax=Winogradskyella sp. TaxID=1883156 RepID=UPI003513D25A